MIQDKSVLLPFGLVPDLSITLLFTESYAIHDYLLEMTHLFSSPRNEIPTVNTEQQRFQTGDWQLGCQQSILMDYRPQKSIGGRSMPAQVHI